jgi:hypothetical protein
MSNVELLPWQAQIHRDHRTHAFTCLGDPAYGDIRCYNCDCRPGGRWGPLPCGIGEDNFYEADLAYRQDRGVQIALCEHNWEFFTTRTVICRRCDAIGQEV